MMRGSKILGVWSARFVILFFLDLLQIYWWSILYMLYIFLYWFILFLLIGPVIPSLGVVHISLAQLWRGVN